MIEQASLIIGDGNWAVKSDSLLGYKLIDGKYYPRDMSVVRATTATRINAQGLVELVPYNLLQYSEDISNSVWTKNEVSVTSSLAPDGSSTAYKLTPNTSNTLHYIYQPTSRSVGNYYTLEIYAKADGYDTCRIATNGNDFGDVNLTSLSISLSNATGSVTDVGNGWRRILITSTSDLSTEDIYIIVGTASFAGNGTSGILFWHTQLVEGSTAKDYLPTTDRLDIARIDYSTGSGALLVEPQRTNIIPYSSSFDNAAWTKFNCNVTANSVISPSGIQDGDTLTSTNSGAGFYQAFSVASGVYTISIYAKKGTKNWMSFVDVAGANYRCWFNLDAGTLGTVTNGTATIEDAGNGWYRCTYTSSTSLSGQYYQLAIAEADNSVTLTSNGTIFVWGAQCEIGNYSTSYIPTTSASVTRNADVISKTGISSLIGQTEGTLFLDFYYDGSTNNHMIINDSSFNSYIYFNSQNANQLWAQIQNINIQFSASASAGRHKLALAYKSGSSAFYLDGVQVGTSATTFTLSGSMSILDFTLTTPNNAINASALWKTRLTNTQLAQLTSI
jgi:hypothetical protein